MPCVHLGDLLVALYTALHRHVHLLPVSPALGINHPTIWQTQQEFSSLIFDVDEIVRQQANILVNIAALQTVDRYGCLRHIVE